MGYQFKHYNHPGEMKDSMKDVAVERKMGGSEGRKTN